jgi:hypothetical protein
VATVAPQVETAEPVATAVPVPTNPPAEVPATPARTATRPATGSTTPSKPAPAKDPCAACLSAAGSGNYGAAGSAYAACTDAGQKARCGALIHGGASEAAKSAALNGNCAQAKSIMAAGMSAGVPSRAFGEVTKNCK